MIRKVLRFLSSSAFSFAVAGAVSVNVITGIITGNVVLLVLNVFMMCFWWWAGKGAARVERHIFADMVVRGVLEKISVAVIDSDGTVTELEASNVEVKEGTMKTIIALLALFTLSGCVSLPNDGDVITVKWVKLATTEEVSNVCDKRSLVGMRGSGMPAGQIIKSPALDGDITNGCAVTAGNVCTIYTLRPRAPDGATRSEHRRIDGPIHQTAGHELDHCYRGSFHTENWEGK